MPSAIVRLLAVVSGIVVSTLSAVASAQLPDRPIKIVVPFQPGGGLDVVARLIAPKLSDVTRQPVIVENRPGANGLIAADFTARAAPDGTTYLLDTFGLAVHPATVKKMPYDPQTGLEPVAQVMSLPYLLVTSPKLEATTLRELIDLAKRQPGKMNAAQGGMSTRMAGELFRLRAGIDVTFVPYKGSNPSLQALMTGETQLMAVDAVSAAGLVRGGKIRALAIASAARSPFFPEVPTAAEAGLPDYTVEAWYGLFAPGGTPQPIVQRMNAEMNRIVVMPDIVQRFATLFGEPVPVTQEAFAQRFRGELARWREVATRANIQPE